MLAQSIRRQFKWPTSSQWQARMTKQLSDTHSHTQKVTHSMVYYQAERSHATHVVILHSSVSQICERCLNINCIGTRAAFVAFTGFGCTLFPLLQSVSQATHKQNLNISVGACTSPSWRTFILPAVCSNNVITQYWQWLSCVLLKTSHGLFVRFKARRARLPG